MDSVQFDNKTFVCRKCVGKSQTAQSIRLSVRNDIVEVLSVGIENIVTGYEIRHGEIAYYGKTTVKLLYSDGLSIQSANFGSDFTSSMSVDSVGANDKLVFDVTTADSKTEVDANTATVSVLLEIVAYAFVSESVDFVTGGDDVFVKNEQIEATTAVNVANIPFVVDREFATTKNIGTVLLADSSLVATDYTVGDGVLTLSGNGVGRLTYLSDGAIVTDVFPFSWTRELDASGIAADSQPFFRTTVRATRVRLDISDDGDNTAFSMEVQATLSVEASQIEALSVVTDLYSADCDFALGRQAVQTTLPCGSASVAKSCTFGVDEDAITVVNVGATVTDVLSEDKRATVKGYITATLLYKGEGGIKGVTKELPFAETVEVDYLGNECSCRGNVTVGEVALSRGELTAQLWISLSCSRNVGYNLITSVEEQPFDKAARPAIEVCIAKKGDTLWNLAKNLHMSEGDLVATNPTLTTPLEEDTRVVIFNKI